MLTLTIVIQGAVVHDPREAGAGLGRGLVDALPQRLEPVHVDHGGGDRHHDAEEGRQEAKAAADLDQDTLPIAGLREHHHHQSGECHLKLG